MSHPRRRLESLSQTISTMKGTRTLKDQQRAKAVRTVRDAVAEGVVEDAPMLANPFVRKNARRRAHVVRRVMKTTWMTTMTIWPLTMSI